MTMEMQSAEVGELAKALCKAQAELEGAKKESTNPFFKTKYADLSSVWDAVRGPFIKNGLSISQPTWHFDSAGVCVVTTLFHTSGQWVRGVLPVMPLKNEPQALGAAITYARRFALAAMCGVTQVDDDGETAQGRSYSAPKPHAVSPPTSPTPIKPAPYGTYTIPFGKYKGLTLDQVSRDELHNYAAYLESTAQKDQKPMSAQTKAFIDQAHSYLEKKEAEPNFLDQAWHSNEPDVS